MLSPEGQREPNEQRRGLWYRTLSAYVVAAAIWMALLGLLYLYFVLSAPKELKGELAGRATRSPPAPR